jgi:hypothetical protein
MNFKDLFYASVCEETKGKQPKPHPKPKPDRKPPYASDAYWKSIHPIQQLWDRKKTKPQPKASFLKNNP